jgi:hypothetical protein
MFQEDNLKTACGKQEDKADWELSTEGELNENVMCSRGEY